MPVSEDCKKLIFSLLEMDKNRRCTIDGIFNSQFVKNFEKEEFDINSSNYDGEEIDNLENYPISTSIIFSNINNENQQDKNQMRIAKSQLLNRYSGSEKINNSSQRITPQQNNNKNNNNKLNNGEKNYQFINIKRVERDNLRNSNISNNENYNNDNYLLNKEQNKKNYFEVDDPYEDEPNAPKNNRRNRIKNKKNDTNNIHNSITKLNLNFNNESIINPFNNKEEENKQNTISNSPKNNNKRKKTVKNNLDLNINPNTIVNNNLLTSRRFREKEKCKEKEKEKQEISVDSNNIKKRNIINDVDNNKKKS